MHITSSPPTFGSSLCLEAVTQGIQPRVFQSSISSLHSLPLPGDEPTLCVWLPPPASANYTIAFLISLAGSIRNGLFQIATPWDLYYHCIERRKGVVKRERERGKWKETMTEHKQSMHRLKRPLLTKVTVLKKEKKLFSQHPLMVVWCPTGGNNRQCHILDICI